MELEICSFASSSSGNCFLVRSETTEIIVDAGITAKKIDDNMKKLGSATEKLSGIMVTHEHVDHIKSLHTVMRKNPAVKVYASKGTIDAMVSKNDKIPVERTVPVKNGGSFMVGDIKVTPFDILHDTAEPVAFAFEKSGRKAAVLTDTGCVNSEIFDNIKDCDVLVLEANHEPNLLLYCRYPYEVKRRILGDRGHLSNEAAGECIIKMLKELGGSKVPKVVLAHLSSENNTPQQAFVTIRNMLENENYYIGKDIELEVAAKDAASQILRV